MARKDEPQRENAELNDRIEADLSKTPLNSGGIGNLGGGAATPGVGIDEGQGADSAPAGLGPGSEDTPGLPNAENAPQPRGSIGVGENAGAAAKADTERPLPKGNDEGTDSPLG